MSPFLSVNSRAPRALRARATLALTLVTVVGLVLGGASAAQATTSFDAPSAVAGAPTGVGAESIEYGGVLITTVRHEDTTFTLEAFDGTTFTVLSTAFLDAQNFYVWRDKLYFSAQSVDGWQLYVYDGVSVTAMDVTQGIMSENVQEITALEVALVFTVHFEGQDVLIASTGVVGFFAGVAVAADGFSALTSFGGSIVGTERNDGNITQVALGETMAHDLATGIWCDTGAVYGEVLYRSCGNDAIGPYLYSLDTAGNFAQVADAPFGPENLTVFDGKLYFSAANGSFVNVLYSFDGTTATEIAGSPQRPDNLVVVGDTLMMHFGRYFESPLEGITSFDGTAFTPVMGSSEGSGMGSGFGVGVGSATPFNPRNLMTFGGSLYFSGTSTALGTTYGFWQVAPGGSGGGSGSAELAATGVSAGAASASLMAGLLGGALLLAGLGALALRRRGLLRG
jgi:hypothetical protein